MARSATINLLYLAMSILCALVLAKHFYFTGKCAAFLRWFKAFGKRKTRYDGEHLSAITVEKEVLRRLSRNVRRHSAWLALIWPLFMMPVLMKPVATGSPSPTTDSQDIAMLVVVGVAISPLILLEEVVTNRAGLWYGALWAAVCSFTLGSTSFLFHILAGLLRLCWMWAYPRPFLCGVGNVLCLICCAINVVRVNEDGVADFDHGSVDRGNYMMSLLLDAVFAQLFCYGVWRTNCSQARAVLNLAGSSIEKVAMKELLNLFCDLSVELDQNLAVKTEEPKLIAMMLPGSTRTSTGIDLRDNMLDDDKENYRRALKEGCDQSTKTGAVQARLFDSMRNTVHVDMFFVQFTDLNESKQYFVGIRERNEEAPLPNLKNFNRSRATARVLRQGQGCGEAAKNKSCVAPPLAALSESDSDASSEASNSGLRKKTPKQAKVWTQGAPKTTMLAKLMSLAEATSRWNFKKREGTCCAFHDSFHEAARAMSQMPRLPCRQNFLLTSGFFCQECKIFYDDALVDMSGVTECDYCMKPLQVRETIEKKIDQSIGQKTIDQSIGQKTIDQSIGQKTIDQSICQNSPPSRTLGKISKAVDSL